MDARRAAVAAIGALLCLGTLAGCSASSTSGDSGREPATVRKSVVDVVERSAAAVGGNWKVYSGPSVEGCGKPATCTSWNGPARPVTNRPTT